ncbi:MAG TPA: RNB domain-containing ribonuclease, partial [Candidatus Limnocylindrales bacterium]|nr:RNB domain-containing ribonuclease [Candidatus Limnocylindrales bacterium]
MITEQEVLHYISKQPRHIAGYKQILHDLGIRGKDRRPLEQLLRDMTHRKKLVAIGKGRWSLPTSASSQDLVVGRLRMHRDGYGFVTPDTGALPPRARGKLLGDIFIPPPEIGSAMHGDQVLVELGRIRPDGKGEGRILRVTERQQETVVGIFHYGDRYNFVKPIDEKVAMDIVIPHGQEYPRHGDEDEFQPSDDDRDLKGPSKHHRSFTQPGGSQAQEGVAQAPSPAQKHPSSTHSTRTQSPPHQDPSRIPSRNERSEVTASGEGPAPLPHRGQPAKSSPSPHRKQDNLGVSEPGRASHGGAQALLPAHTPGSKGKHAGGQDRTLHPRQQSPHRVLGEESRRRTWDDLENVIVEVEITQWPSANQNPRGRVVEILGYKDDFGVDVEIVIRKHHIRHVFPPAVLEEAQEISPVIPKTEIAHRRDFRDLPIVTIDGETARDFDDAVLVQRLPNGNYQLHVHIADVAQYVEDGTALDEEARLRGTSVYFPDRAVPMLPLELSTDICSLRPELDRLVLSCVMEIDPQGEIQNYELAEGIIRSAARMTYTDVNAIIEGDPHLRRRYAEMANNFELMLELAKILNRRRVKRGSIDFDLPEPVIEFDDFGIMKSISPSE